MRQFKVNDVYHCGPCKIDRHCFEGLLVVMEIRGELWLVDTYWGVKTVSDNKRWQCSEAESEFPGLTYYCNLDEIEKARSNAPELYKPEDVFCLHDQHACVPRCTYYYVRKGAKPDYDVQIKSLMEKVQGIESEIRSSISTIKFYTSQIAKLEVEKERANSAVQPTVQPDSKVQS